MFSTTWVIRPRLAVVVAVFVVQHGLVVFLEAHGHTFRYHG